MQEIGLYIIQSVGGLYATICVLRVLLQLVRADYYNQVSQFIVLATRAPVQVLRPILPNVGRLDSAALVWAVLVGYLIFQSGAFVEGFGLTELFLSLAWVVLGLLSLILSIVFYGLIGVIIISWLTMMGGMRISHPIVSLMQQIVYPFMAPFQKVIPSFGGIDLSPIALIFSIRICQMILIELAFTLEPFARYRHLVVGF